MRVKINKSLISGKLQVNPSKSYEQRYLAAAMLAGGHSIIHNIGSSDDVVSAREIIKSFGYNYLIENNSINIFVEETNISDTIYCHESAFNARLFTPICCAKKTQFTLTGSGSLLHRTIADDFGVLQLMGCFYKSTQDCVPVVFSKSQLLSGNYNIEGSRSSQFISGLLMSFPIIDGDTRLVVNNPVSINYLFMTIETIKNFGINIRYVYDTKSKLSFYIPGNQKYIMGEHFIEGDWGSAAFLLVAAAINGSVKIKGLTRSSMQPDKEILNVFDMTGVKYSWLDDILYVEKSNIKSFNFNATNCPDLIPILSILAIFADGISTIQGASRLINKESSRAEVLLEELTKLNVNIMLDNDTIKIHSNNNLSYGVVNSHNDHRIAMAFAILGLSSNEGIEIEQYECVTKSYPQFFEDLKQLGVTMSF